MNHNLTPKQLNSLRWLVSQIEAGQLKESIIIVDMSSILGSAFVIGNFRGDIPEYLDLGVLDALVVDGALVASGGKFTVTKRAYEIVAFESGSIETDFLTKLRDILIDYFNETELRNLAFDLDINYDALPGQGTSDKAREIVTYLKRRKQIDRLVKRGVQLRAGIDWSDS